MIQTELTFLFGQEAVHLLTSFYPLRVLVPPHPVPRQLLVLLGLQVCVVTSEDVVPDSPTHVTVLTSPLLS